MGKFLEFIWPVAVAVTIVIFSISCFVRLDDLEDRVLDLERKASAKANSVVYGYQRLATSDFEIEDLTRRTP